MIKVLEEDIVFNELQNGCKGQSPCVCPNVVQPIETACPNCNQYNEAGGCKWTCKRVPGIGYRANFVSGCGTTFCSAPDNEDFVCRDCPTADTACVPGQDVDGNPTATAGRDYLLCIGGCEIDPISGVVKIPTCVGAGNPDTDCVFTAKQPTPQ